MRKFLKWTGIVLLPSIAIVLAANAYFVWTTDAQLERQLAAIRAAGDPVTIAELAPKPIPPEKNANTYLRQANADVEAVDALLYSRMSDSDDKEWEESYGVWSARNPHSLMPLKLQKKVKAIFAAHPNAIPLLEKAAACPDYDAQLDYAMLVKETVDCMQPSREPRFPRLLPDVLMKIRNAARVLMCRGNLLVAEGNRDEAVRTALAIFRLSHHCRHAFGAITYLVSDTIAEIAVNCANNALQAGPISPDVRQALDAELASQERMEGIVQAIKNERAFIIELFQNLPLRNFWLISRWRWNEWESECLDELQAFLAMLNDEKSYSETVEAIRRIEAIRPQKDKIIMMGIVGMQNIHQANANAQARIRCLRILNALQTHVLLDRAVVPKLADLGLPLKTTTDPFSGEPLHIKKIPNGWLVYSVGLNLQDDGGKIDDYQTDVGVGPPPLATKPD